MLIGKLVALVVTVHGIKFREQGNYAHPRKWASSERNLLLQAQQGPSEPTDRYSYGWTEKPFEFTNAIPEIAARSQFVDEIHTTGSSDKGDKENERAGSTSFGTRQVTPYVDMMGGSPYAASQQWSSSGYTPQVYGNMPYRAPGNGNWPNSGSGMEYGRQHWTPGGSTPQVHGNMPYLAPGNGNWPNPGAGPYTGMEYRSPYVGGQQWIPRGSTAPVYGNMPYLAPGNGNWPNSGSGMEYGRQHWTPGGSTPQVHGNMPYLAPGNGNWPNPGAGPYTGMEYRSPYVGGQQWIPRGSTAPVYGNMPYLAPGNGNGPNPGSGPYTGVEYRPPHAVGQQWIPRGNTPVMRHPPYRNPGNGNWPIPGSGQHSDIGYRPPSAKGPEWIPMMGHPPYGNPGNGNWPKKNTNPWEISSTPSPRLSHQPHTEYNETKNKTDDDEDRMLTDQINDILRSIDEVETNELMSGSRNAYQHFQQKPANGGLPQHVVQSLEFLAPYPRYGAEPISAGDMSVRKYRTPRKNDVVHQGYRNTPFTYSGKRSHLSKTGYWSQAPMNPLNQFDSRNTTPSPFRWSVVPDVPMKSIQTWNGPPRIMGTPSPGKRMPFQSVQTYSVFTSPSGNAHSVHYRSHNESEGNDFQRLTLPFDKGFDLPNLEISHFKTNPLFANGDHMDTDLEEPKFGGWELGDAPWKDGSWGTVQRRLMPLTSTAHDLSSLETMASI